MLKKEEVRTLFDQIFASTQTHTSIGATIEHGLMPTMPTRAGMWLLKNPSAQPPMLATFLAQMLLHTSHLAGLDWTLPLDRQALCLAARDELAAWCRRCFT